MATDFPDKRAEPQRTLTQRMIGLADLERDYLRSSPDRKLVGGQESGATTSRRKIHWIYFEPVRGSQTFSFAAVTRYGLVVHIA